MVNFRWLSAVLLSQSFLCSLHEPDECTGQQRNKIVHILEDVEWKGLAQQLEINQEQSIHSACENKWNPLPCKLGEVVRRFINSRKPQSCCETLKAIASGVESLPSTDINAASKLRKMCTSTESEASDENEPISEQNQPTPTQSTSGESHQASEEDQSMIPAGYLIFTILVGILTLVFLVYRNLSGERDGSSDQRKMRNKGAYPWQVWQKAATETGNKLIRRHGAKFVIAIVDSGIKMDHISFGPASQTKPKILRESRDFTNGNDITDSVGHGTNCAGIAAGNRVITGEDNEGGVASEAKLLICKVTNSRKFEINKVIKALRYIKELHEQEKVTIHVVSMSFGFKNGNRDLKKCIDDLNRLGIICVASTGNDGDTPGTKVLFPARYPNVISVGSHDKYWKLAQFAADPQNNDDINYTTFGEAICAPSIHSNEPFSTFSGTSMAAPVAAGLIACILERELWLMQTSSLLNEVRPSLDLMTQPGEKLKSLRPYRVFTDEPYSNSTDESESNAEN